MKWHELDIAKLVEIVPGQDMNEKFRNSFDIKYGDYDYTNDLRIVSHEELEKYLRKTLDSMNGKREYLKVLITGANNGYEVQFFPGCEITALDLSWRALKKLSEKYPFVKTKVGNFNKLDFSDSTFSIYCCLRSIQSYGVDINETINEAIRVTRPDGLCIFSISNGYIVDGAIQKGMFDPSRNVYNEELPKKKTDELIKIFKDKNINVDVFETQSEVVIKAKIKK